MGSVNRRPWWYWSETELARWYARTPKWVMAEIITTWAPLIGGLSADAPAIDGLETIERETEIVYRFRGGRRLYLGRQPAEGQEETNDGR